MVTSGCDEIGVMSLTLDKVDDDDRRLLRRLAGLVADMLVTKNNYTDQFLRARRRAPMSVPAEIQWSLLPPLTMTTPQVAVAGMLEPAYDVAGDSLDYALNDDVLHLAVIDAMGHGLNAAVLATVAVLANRALERRAEQLDARLQDVGEPQQDRQLDAARDELVDELLHVDRAVALSPRRDDEVALVVDPEVSAAPARDVVGVVGIGGGPPAQWIVCE